MLESKVVISACGHDGPFGASGVKRLQKLGMARRPCVRPSPPPLCRCPFFMMMQQAAARLPSAAALLLPSC